MINIKKLIHHSCFFPVMFLLLHVLTYGTYFFIANEKAPILWLDERRFELVNLVWFYGTWWPNWVGIFVFGSYLWKKVSLRLALCYLFGLYVEQFFIGADYMGSYEEFPLTVASYRVFETHLHFTEVGEHRVIHLTVLFSIFHIIIIFLKKKILSRKGRKHGHTG